ncbi:MAG: glycosyltransferase family 8 protein [Lachnospiraceae bacterium]|nr:glycosyltransferase family 8 protein [Lachnospiraceae bacterium]
MKLKPYFEKNSVAVSITSSDEYSPFLQVLIRSIVSNSSQSTCYDIVVLDDGIETHHKCQIEHLIKDNSNISIRFFDVSNFFDGVKLHTAMHVTKSTYNRLMAIKIFSEYEKVLYLDCDTVVNDDIAKLYNTDVSGYLLAAVADSIMGGWCYMDSSDFVLEQKSYIEKELGITNPHLYFNAGVMLLNIKEFNKQCLTSEKLLDIASQRKWKWFDQDVLNLVCKDKVLLLSNRWNTEVHVYSKIEDISEWYMPDEYFKEYLSSIENPLIVHYAGHVLPVYEPLVDRADLFWKYAHETTIFWDLYNMEVIETVRKYKKIPFFERIKNHILPYGSTRREMVKRIVKAVSK